MSDALELLLQGKIPDPRTGEPLPVPVRSIVLDRSLEGREAELVAALGLGRSLAVVSAPDTERALGARVRRALAAAGNRLAPIRLHSHP